MPQPTRKRRASNDGSPPPSKKKKAPQSPSTETQVSISSTGNPLTSTNAIGLRRNLVLSMKGRPASRSQHDAAAFKLTSSRAEFNAVGRSDTDDRITRAAFLRQAAAAPAKPRPTPQLRPRDSKAFSQDFYEQYARGIAKQEMVEKREREEAAKKAQEAAERDAVEIAKAAAQKALEEAQRLAAEAAAKQAEAEKLAAAAKAEADRLTAVAAAAAARSAEHAATPTSELIPGNINHPSKLAGLVEGFRAQDALQKGQRLVMDYILVPPPPPYCRAKVSNDVEMADPSPLPRGTEEVLCGQNDQVEEDPEMPGLMDCTDDEGADNSLEISDDQNDPDNAGEGGLPPRADAHVVEDLFTAPGPMTKLVQKFVHDKSRGSPPLESEDSGSDFAETQRAAKIAQGRGGQTSESEDDDELAGEVVESSPAQRLRARSGKGKEVDTEPSFDESQGDAHFDDEASLAEPANGATVESAHEALIPEPTHEAHVSEPTNKAPVQDPSNEAPIHEPVHEPSPRQAADTAQEDAGDIDLEAENVSNGKGGRPSNEYLQRCARLNDAFTKMVKAIAKAHDKTDEQVIRSANLNFLLKKASNFWNDFQAFKRLVAPDEVVGKGLDYFRQWIKTEYKAYQKASKEEKAVIREEVYAKLEEFSKDETMVRSAFRRFMEAEESVQGMFESLCRFNSDLLLFSLLCYVGKDHPTLQRSGIITGSEEGRCLIAENKVKVEDIVDGVTAKAKAARADELLTAMAEAVKEQTSAAGAAHLISGAEAAKQQMSAGAAHSISRAEKKSILHAAKVSQQTNGTVITVPPVTGNDPRSRTTQRLSAQLFSITKVERHNFPYGNLTYHCYINKFRIVNWPVQQCPHIPHKKRFNTSDVKTPQWKVLDAWTADGTLRLEPWTDEEKKLPSTSLEYGVIPLLKDAEGNTLAFVHDFAPGVSQPPAKDPRILEHQSASAVAKISAPVPDPSSALLPSDSAPAPSVSSAPLLSTPAPAAPAPAATSLGQTISDSDPYAFLQDQILQLQAQLAAVRPQDTSSDHYVVVKEGQMGPDGLEEMPEIALKTSAKSNLFVDPSPASSLPYRGETGGHPRRSLGINPQHFYHAQQASLQQPPSNRPLPPHHPAARVLPLTARSISHPTVTTTTTSTTNMATARRVASQPSSTKENDHYQPGGVYYKQRYAYDGVEGPSREIFKAD